jgi:cobalt-zinc-cadmium efflux system outer membrane protein
MDWSRCTFLAMAFASSGCLAGRARSDYEELRREVRRAEPSGRAQRHASESSDDDTALAQSADLDRILRIALDRNPDIGEARERVRAALARVPASSRLPDLEFKYEQWAVPLDRPYDLSKAQTIMVGLRQSFPAPGSLPARSRQSMEDAKIAVDAQHGRQLDIAQQVRHAYYDFYRADREYKVHLEHVELASHLVELAREHYQTGHGTQQDVLRAIVELSRLHEDIATIEQQLVSSRALLNALMARPLDAAIGSPPDIVPAAIAVRVEELEKLVVRRPELASAERVVKRSQAALDGAKSTANWPTFMIGTDYWYMPTVMAPTSPHAYSAMVALTLPWLNPSHREEVRAAEHSLAADQKALESIKNTTAFQVRDGAAKLDAARYSYRIIDHDLLPQAQQSFDAARGAYVAGTGDALGLIDTLRSFLQVRLDRYRALARMQSSLADLERAVGGALRDNDRGGQP